MRTRHPTRTSRSGKIDVEQEKIKYIFYVKDSALEEEAKAIVDEFCKSNPSFDVIDF